MWTEIEGPQESSSTPIKDVIWDCKVFETGADESMFLFKENSLNQLKAWWDWKIHCSITLRGMQHNYARID